MLKILTFLFYFASVFAVPSFAEMSTANKVSVVNKNLTEQKSLNEKVHTVEEVEKPVTESELSAPIQTLSTTDELATDSSTSVESTPQVGKHVMANMDAGSMIVSLLLVLALIIVSAFVLKRFNLTQQSANQLRVIANLSLGAKERIVVVQVGDQQLVLGVCSQQISLLKHLETPLDTHKNKPLVLPKNVLSFLQKNTTSTKDSK